MKEEIYIIVTSKRIEKFISIIIIINVVSIILETNKNLNLNYKSVFTYIEYISIFIFTIEYLLRFWTANLNKKSRKIIGSRKLGYVFSIYGILDLLAILPFYLPLLIAFDLRIVRILRLFRLLRILKLSRYSQSFKIINKVIVETRPQLAVTLFVALILLVLSSTLMFYAENPAQPEKFSSILDSLWWSIAKLTTVDYIDVYPITSFEKILSTIIAMIGVGFIAFPTGILSSAFIESIHNNEDKKGIDECPNCRRK